MTGRPQQWIVVPNWFGQDDPSEGLQHYKDREPKWIKNYRRLLYKDEYRDLSGHCRAILHGVWLEYASTDGRLRADSSSLSSRLALRVTSKHIESLSHAGFIVLSASKPLALSEQNASLEVETEEETDTEKRKDVVKSKALPSRSSSFVTETTTKPSVNGKNQETLAPLDFLETLEQAEAT